MRYFSLTTKHSSIISRGIKLESIYRFRERVYNNQLIDPRYSISMITDYSVLCKYYTR